jgi:hypothetical protein
VLAEISGREEEQVALAAALPTRIPAPLGWRKNLALVQLGQLTETVQRMRVTLRQREQSEETLCVWVQRTLEELSVELMEEFAAERALVEQQTRQVAELRAELRETLATVTDTWKLTLPMLTRLRKLDDIKAARVDQETLVREEEHQERARDPPHGCGALDRSIPLCTNRRCKTTPSRPPFNTWWTRCRRSRSAASCWRRTTASTACG